MNIYGHFNTIYNDVISYCYLCDRYNDLLKIEYEVKKTILAKNNFKYDKFFSPKRDSQYVKTVQDDKYICLKDSLTYKNMIANELIKLGYKFDGYSPVESAKNDLLAIKNKILIKSKIITGVDYSIMQETEEALYISFLVRVCKEFVKIKRGHF